jgi:hypothetical protein
MEYSKETQWILLRWIGYGKLPAEIVLRIASYIDVSCMVMLYHAHIHIIYSRMSYKFVHAAAYHGHIHLVNMYGTMITNSFERNRIAIAAVRGSHLEIVRQWLPTTCDDVTYLLNFATLYSNHATWSWLISNLNDNHAPGYVMSRVEDKLPFETDVIALIHHQYGKQLLRSSTTHGRDWIARVYAWMEPRIALDCDIYAIVRSVDNIDLFQVVFSASMDNMRPYRWKSKIRAWLDAL